MSVENRIVIITGATGGLGRIVTKQFAQQGACLVLVGKSVEKLQHLVKELALQEERILIKVADLSQPESAQTLVQEILELHRADNAFEAEMTGMTDDPRNLEPRANEDAVEDILAQIS